MEAPKASPPALPLPTDLLLTQRSTGVASAGEGTPALLHRRCKAVGKGSGPIGPPRKDRDMKKLLFGASALALTAGFSGAAFADFSLTILHINDFHSRFESITGTDSTCNAEGETKGECFGGIARLKTAIDAERAAAKTAGENSVLFSAGDEFQGSLFYTHYKSEIVADFMNDMGF